MAAGKCSPPKGQSVKAHTRSKPVQRKKIAGAARAKLPYVVRDSRTGRVVSRHRTLSAAIRQEKRLDLQAYRAGKGRPYDAGKA